MPPTEQRSRYRRIQLVFGLILAAMFYVEVSQKDHEPIVAQRSAVVLADPQPKADPFEKLLRRNPIEAMIQARERHVQDVKDYRCTFVKQELLPSGMSAEQEIEIKFRQHPQSVVMHWIRNPDLANRVVYVQGRWRDMKAKDPEDRELAICQPGAVAQLFVKSVKLSIHGSLAKKTARRSIDEFGFKRTLDLLIKYCQIAETRNELVLEFRGEARFDGRPVWVLYRCLPYTGDTGPYTDRTAVIYIDKESHVPVAVYCYSDDAQRPANLLGKYEYRNIRFDVGLTEADFDPASYGM